MLKKNFSVGKMALANLTLKTRMNHWPPMSDIKIYTIQLPNVPVKVRLR